MTYQRALAQIAARPIHGQDHEYVCARQLQDIARSALAESKEMGAMETIESVLKIARKETDQPGDNDSRYRALSRIVTLVENHYPWLKND